MKQPPPKHADVGNWTGRDRLPDGLGPQEAHACRVIEVALESAEPLARQIDVGTARVIAASLHHGPGSALQKFASSGRLRPVAVLQEIADGRHGLPQARWAAALSSFARATDVARSQQSHGPPGVAHRPVRPHRAQARPIPGNQFATPTTHHTKGGTTNGTHTRITR
jgi:hypothetical protein